MTVRMQTIKNQNDIPQALQGIVSFQVLDNNVEAVVVKVGEDYIRFSKSDSYSSNLKRVKLLSKKPVDGMIQNKKLSHKEQKKMLMTIDICLNLMFLQLY